MKKLIYLVVLLCLPIFIFAQQVGNLRNTIDNCDYRDSIMKMILQHAENWRDEYNSKSKNQISPFKAQDPEYVSSSADGKIIYGIVSYSAYFQKENNNLESIDSLLLLSINSTCSQAILFSRQVGKANRQNVEDRIIFTWKETNGLWQHISHAEAIKNEY